MRVRRFLLLNVVLLAATVGALFFGLTKYRSEMLKCLSDQSLAKIPEGYGDKRIMALLVFQLYMILSTFWNRMLCSANSVSKSDARREFTPSWSMAIMWYQTWYYAIAYLRELEGEYTCSLSKNKAYGISGHSYYYIYTSMLVLSSSIRKRDDEDSGSSLKKFFGKSMRCILWILKFVQPMLSAFVVYETIKFGYHTLKQVLTGMYFSCIVLLLLGTVESEDGRSVVRPVVHSVVGYTFYKLLANLDVYPVKTSNNYLYILAMALQFLESCWSHFKSHNPKKDKKD